MSGSCEQEAWADSAIEVLTIGHSTLSYEEFLGLLRQASVTAIADVRSAPFSRHFPHFNRDWLRSELRLDQIAYVFLGEELGGRPKGGKFFDNGIANYERMAETEVFADGLKRIVDGAKKYRIALMCSEHDPLDCHRCLLVGRALHERGVVVRHILNDGQIISHRQIEARLMKVSGKSDVDLFESPAKRLAAAYRDRATRVAFVERKDEPSKSAILE
ncbi:DUF488 family protein [Aestuariivirga sp. YIM B02566]|uniref:DUF488 domain-containing protein n=1 Tax=Taklimakanibacter albus TaxID=2800327 RepID=A0ACC5QZI6_9HYPH|nr:DUF488 domain-containing protein [Aestuariivirga sp. YIM B02566]MBK1865792.1 DUF488 domain-containing protein [Aestuariivirga sp. YIM B02566]